MKFKLFALFAGLLLLSACGTPRATTADAAGAGAAAPAEVTQPAERDVTSEAVGAPRPGTQEDLAANIGDRVFFGFDRYDLTPESQDTVAAWAQWLQDFPALQVAIEGHADERGTREYNLALGERRAVSVRDYLVAQGVRPDRLRTISYGKERPAALGSNERAWAENRRGVMVVN